MKAVITGASSGLGADMARVLIDEGYEVVLVARRKTRLEKLQKELGDKASYIVMDVSSTYNCMELYNSLKKEDVGILINCAGFGLYGDFVDSNIDKELDMIDLNIKSVHTLTKLFLKDFVKKDRGYILNVASMAGFMPGPGMATYYATKSYVLSFTEAIREELRRSGSGVSVSCLCPGPVNTNFNKVAKVEFSSKGMNSMDVAKYAIKNMFNEKLLIIPSLKMKLVHVLVKFLPVKLVMRFVYNFQKSKS